MTKCSLSGRVGGQHAAAFRANRNQHPLEGDATDGREHEHPDGRATRVLTEDKSPNRTQPREYTASTQPGPPVPGESLPGVVEATGADILLSFPFADRSAEYPDDLPRRTAARAPDRRSTRPRADAARACSTLSSRSNSSWKWRPGAAERPEVRQEERVGIPRQDAVGARAPGLEIDVGRRRRRHDVRPVAAPDARGVADERDAARWIEVRSRGATRVLASARRRARARRPRAVRRLTTTLTRAAGTGSDGTPQPVHVVAVEPVALAISFDGSIMCRAPRSWTNTSIAGIQLHQRPGRARVVEVDVRQQHLPHVRDRDPLRASAPSGDRRAWSTDRDRRARRRRCSSGRRWR